MNKLDLIIDALEMAEDKVESAYVAIHINEALAAARELRDMKPVAWITRQSGDGGRVLQGYETCNANDYGAISVYTLEQSND